MANKTAEKLMIFEDGENEKKSETLFSKLQKRDESRILKAQVMKNIKDGSKVREENSNFFTKHFQEESQNVQDMLNCHGLSPTDRSLVLEHFDAITASYQRLQKFFNDSVMFLPSYESRKARLQLSDLLEKIEKRRTEMLPKKKFAFKSKSKTIGKTEKDGITDIAQLKDAAAQKYASAVANFQDDCSISDRTGETIILKNEVVCRKDMSFSHLRDCKVFIYGTPGTVHISDVRKCTFVTGPVSGSVFVERCVESIIATGCQQLRVHHTLKTDFYLHVTSRAIIEDTSEVRFAPYNLQYPGIEEHFLSSGLDRLHNNWTSVDDFNWLAADTPSPNWKIMEEADRKQQW